MAILLQAPTMENKQNEYNIGYYVYCVYRIFHVTAVNYKCAIIICIQNQTKVEALGH